MNGLRWTDALDVTLVAALIWVGLVWVRRSRARFALVGVALVGVIYLLASRLHLQLTAWILQGFFAVFVIFVVVVFQEDLRRLFEQIAIWGLRRRSPVLQEGTTESVVKAVRRMAAARTGMLLVIPGREPLDRYIDGGVSLDAWLSEALLLSLFDTRTPGHDGAAILVSNQLTRFAVHLPLSSDRAQIGEGGTRHAAALGLAERSDALCVVVSEERGTISVARDGAMRELSGHQELERELDQFLETHAREVREALGWSALRTHLPEGALSIALALTFWYVLVPGATPVQVTQPVPVVVKNLPDGFALIGAEPATVDVTFEGLRRELALENLDETRIRVDALLVELGRRTFQVDSGDVSHPDSVRVVAVDPGRVRLSVRQQGEN